MKPIKLLTSLVTTSIASIGILPITSCNDKDNTDPIVYECEYNDKWEWYTPKGLIDSSGIGTNITLKANTQYIFNVTIGSRQIDYFTLPNHTSVYGKWTNLKFEDATIVVLHNDIDITNKGKYYIESSTFEGWMFNKDQPQAGIASGKISFGLTLKSDATCVPTFRED